MNRILLVAISFILTSCVTVAPVVNPNTELSIYGVSLMPPQNEGWIVMVANGYQVTLAKSTSNKNESLVANVSIFQLPELSSDKEFLEHVIRGHAEAPDIGRFEDQGTSDELSSLNGAVCIKYHHMSKDKAAHVQGGNTAIMILENYGYNCQHPKNPRVGVHAEYSLRHFSETTYPLLEQNSDAFFNTIEFGDF